MTEVEIELQMKKALEKLPFEIKKIKVMLFIVKKFKNFKKIFKF